jgi:hypothetical protein
MRKKQKNWKVTYSGTRHFNTYATKREAVEQARYAVGTGNMKSCIYKRVSARGAVWSQVKCLRRRSR